MQELALNTIQARMVVGKDPSWIQTPAPIETVVAQFNAFTLEFPKIRTEHPIELSVGAPLSSLEMDLRYWGYTVNVRWPGKVTTVIGPALAEVLSGVPDAYTVLAVTTSVSYPLHTTVTPAALINAISMNTTPLVERFWEALYIACCTTHEDKVDAKRLVRKRNRLREYRDRCDHRV
jgi:hypothetical protein